MKNDVSVDEERRVMFDKLSFSLRTLIRQGVEGAPDVEFVRPLEGYETKLKGDKVVNVFLYDVREESQLRSNEPTVRRMNGVVTTVPAPFLVTCSYLITAWANNDSECKEQKLLGEVMRFLASLPIIPGEMLGLDLDDPKKPPVLLDPISGINLLKPPLSRAALIKHANSGGEPPIPLRIGSLGENASQTEFWTALGNKIRPAFESWSRTIDLAAGTRNSGNPRGRDHSQDRSGADQPERPEIPG